jgi:hypothetical protein
MSERSVPPTALRSSRETNSRPLASRGAGLKACAQRPLPRNGTFNLEPNRRKVVTAYANGTFEVELASQPMTGADQDSALSRMSIEKRFRGDLEGTSRGEMLGARTDVEGSAGYVAIERVSGTLHGRRGTFILQHSGTMHRGVQEGFSVTVVPDSGSGDLVGLTGRMTIRIEDGDHFYEFEYTLADEP